MKKNVLRIIIIVILLSFFCGVCFATTGVPDDFAGKMSGVSTMPTSTSVSNNTGIKGVLNTIINLIQYAGTGISVIMVTICGAKYMLASANEKADLKKQLVPLVIGAIILFAAVNFVGIIADVGNNLNQ